MNEYEKKNLSVLIGKYLKKTYHILFNKNFKMNEHEQRFTTSLRVLEDV